MEINELLIKNCSLSLEITDLDNEIVIGTIGNTTMLVTVHCKNVFFLLIWSKFSQCIFSPNYIKTIAMI